MSSSSSSCADLQATFEYVPSKILIGIDPSTDAAIWACVQENSDFVGRNNDGVKLVVTSGDPDCVKIEVADSTKATANLGSFTTNSEGNDEAAVTIQGISTTESNDTATGVRLEAKNKETGEVVADNCKVMVLPFLNLTYSDYRVIDPDNDCTTNFTAPKTSGTTSLLNEIYNRQGCLGFSLNVEGTAGIAYEHNDDCKLNEDDKDENGNDLFDEISGWQLNPWDQNWEGDINSFWVKKSRIFASKGCPDPDQDHPPARGVALFGQQGGIICVDDAGNLARLGMAHEFGHIMALDHYEGPFPDNVIPLLRKGFDENCEYQDIGKWLTKDQWVTVNYNVQEYQSTGEWPTSI